MKAPKKSLMRKSKLIIPTLQVFALSSVVGFLSFWTWNTHYSDACLKLRQVGTISEDLLYALTYQRYLEDLLTSIEKRLDAYSASVFIYDSALQRRGKIASGDLDGDKSAFSFGWVRLDSDDAYLSQLDNHKIRQCWVADVESLPNGIYKQQAQASELETQVSCPVYYGGSELFGYVSLGFQKKPLNAQAIADQLASHPVTKVLRKEF